MNTELSRNLERFEEKFRTFLSDPSLFKNTRCLAEMLDEKDRMNNEVFERSHLTRSAEDIRSLKSLWQSKQELDGLINAYIISKVSETHGENDRLKKKQMIPTKDVSSFSSIIDTNREFLPTSYPNTNNMRIKTARRDNQFLSTQREKPNEQLLNLQAKKYKASGLIDEYLREEVQFLTSEAQRANSLAMSQEAIIMKNNEEIKTLNCQLSHQTHLANTYTRKIQRLETAELIYKESIRKIYSLNEKEWKQFYQIAENKLDKMNCKLKNTCEASQKAIYCISNFKGDNECLKLLIDCKDKDLEIANQNIPEMYERNEKLKKALFQKDSLIKEQENIVLNLQKHLEKCTNAKNRQDEETERLQKEIDELKNSYGKEKQDHLQFKIDTNRTIIKKDLLVKDLKVKLSNIDQEYNQELFSQYAEIESLRAEKEKTQLKLKRFNDNQKTNKQELTDKDLEIRRLGLDIDELKQYCSVTTAEKNRLERVIQDLNLEIQEYHTNIEDLSATIQDLKREVHIREKSCKSIQKSYDQAILLNDNTSQTLKEAQEQLSFMRNSFSAKDSLVEHLNYEIESAKSEMVSEEEEDHSQIDTYMKDLDQLKTENETSNSETGQLFKENQYLLDQIQQLNQENTLLKETLEKKKIDIDLLNERTKKSETNNEKKIDESFKENLKLVQKLSAKDQELDELHQQIEENNEKFRKESEFLRNSITSLNSEKHELLATKEQLLKHIENLRIENIEEIPEINKPKDHASCMSKNDLHEIINTFKQELGEIIDDENTQDPLEALQKLKNSFYHTKTELNNATDQLAKIAHCLNFPEYTQRSLIEHIEHLALFYNTNPLSEFADNLSVQSLQLARCVNEQTDRINNKIISIERKMNKQSTELDIKQGLLSQVKRLLGVNDDVNILSKIREFKPFVSKIPKPNFNS